jgi:hypothetical protein
VERTADAVKIAETALDTGSSFRDECLPSLFPYSLPELIPHLFPGHVIVLGALLEDVLSESRRCYG